jgi:hypothetical protein
MAKYPASREGKEASRFECWVGFDGEQEMKEEEEAWTKWAFSVFRRPDQSLEITPYGFGDTRGN